MDAPKHGRHQDEPRAKLLKLISGDPPDFQESWAIVHDPSKVPWTIKRFSPDGDETAASVPWTVIVELRRRQPVPNLVFESRETAKAWLRDPDHALAPERGWDDLLDPPERTVAQKHAMTLHNAVRDFAAEARLEPDSLATWKAAHAKRILRHTLVLYEKTDCSCKEPDGSTKNYCWVEPQPDGSWVEIWDFIPGSCWWSGTAAVQDANKEKVWASCDEEPGDDDGNICVQLPLDPLIAAKPTYAKTE